VGSKNAKSFCNAPTLTQLWRWSAKVDCRIL
jgi:hypothetical protein